MDGPGWTAISAVGVALVSVFGVKMLDALTLTKTRKLDELADVRKRQDDRIQMLEKRLEEKDKEFDLYRETQAARFAALEREHWECQNKIARLEARLKGVHDG